MSESNPDLPDDLIAEILVWLPVKPICRFKCVSKPWRSLLSNPKFVKANLKLHIDDPGYFIYVSRIFSNLFMLYLNHDAAESINVRSDGVAGTLIQSELKWAALVGSCHGLIVLANKTDLARKMLINPITLETAHISDDRDFDSNEHRSDYGFGYDSSYDDYKIVSLSVIIDYEVLYGSKGDTMVDVYSLKMKCWKRIANTSYVLDVGDHERDFAGVFLNGRLHWLGYCKRLHEQVIICFDLAREEFVDEALIPVNMDEDLLDYDISLFNGCLALVSMFSRDADGRDTINIWVMREYGVRDSWTKFTTIYPDDGRFKHFYTVIGGLNDDEIVLKMYTDHNPFVAYNWRNGVFRELIIAGLPGEILCGRVTPFKASLLSPNHLH